MPGWRASRRARRCALRHAMADLGWQETISFSFVDERWERDLAGNSNPIRVRQPDRSTLVGDALEPARQPGRGAARQSRAQGAARARVRARPGIPARRRGRRRTDRRSPGVSQPLRLGGLAYGPADAAAMGRRRARGRLLRRQGRCRSPAGAARRALRRRDASGAASRSAAPAIEIDGVQVGVVGELHPRWRQATTCRARRSCSRSTLEALMRRHAAASSRRCEAAVGVARHRRHRRPRRLARGADGRHRRPAPRPVVRSATLFDIYEPKARRRRIAAGERSLAVRLELRDDEPHADRRAHRARRRRRRRPLDARLGVRLRAAVGRRRHGAHPRRTARPRRCCRRSSRRR